MSESAERYLRAARRESTERRYRQAVEHFEQAWGGLLPASSESVVRYLAAYGAHLSSSTLRAHLAALAQWHVQHGFVDPTKAPRVRDTLRGIQALHPRPVKQAQALQLQTLEVAVDGLQAQLATEEASVRLRAARDQALILLGFWRAFRGDELCRLRVEHIMVHQGEGLEIFLPSSKTDRAHRGRTLGMPALKRCCPVDACQHWLALSGLEAGPVFRAIDRWGHLGEAGLNPNSLSRILRQAFVCSGIDGEECPLAAPRLRHLGQPQPMEQQGPDGICRLARRAVGGALRRRRCAVWRVGAPDRRLSRLATIHGD